jgi:hypothetical protein
MRKFEHETIWRSMVQRDLTLQGAWIMWTLKNQLSFDNKGQEMLVAEASESLKE